MTTSPTRPASEGDQSPPGDLPGPTVPGGLEEPSVLDYVKARLTPWRGPVPSIPPIESPDAPDQAVPAGGPAQAVNVAAAGASSATQRESASAAGSSLFPLARPALEVPAQAAAMPWRSLTAFGLAVLGQRAFEPPDRSLTLGLVFYLAGLALMAWAWRSGEWALAEPPEGERGSDTLAVRPAYLLASVPLAFLTYLAFGGGEFTPLNLVLWALALGFLVTGLWRQEAGATPWQARVRAWAREHPWQITLTPWTFAVLAGFLVVAFFRLYRLNQVPPEMISDHAEKLLDVADVLDGQWRVFFPRNTGREAIQMVLTAGIVRLFGTGLTFLSLKIGTALAGLATLPFMYLLGVEIANRRTGLLAMVLAGMAYWPNVITRIGLRFTLFPLFVAPTLYFLLRGLRRARRNDFILAGIFLGFGLHGYSSFRIVPFLVLLAVGLYLLHGESRGRRPQALWGLVVLALVSLFVFLPLFRYWVDHPGMFSYRVLTRLGSLERPLPGPAWKIFLQNLWNAVTMFFWSNGDIWVHSVTMRPALDGISAALLGLGLGGLLLRYSQRRTWVDLFLVLSIPILMLPSILSLAFPAENPSLNRTSGAIVPVFLITGLALDGILTSLDTRRWSRWGAWPVGALAALVLIFAGTQNYDLVFRKYQRQYQLASWNTSEIGEVIRGFAQSVGDRDSAWVVGFPHWVDTRLVGINAGFPRKDYAIWPDQFSETRLTLGPKLFVLKPEDQNSLQALRELYPDGVVTTHLSALETKTFLLYFVPPE